MMTFGQVSDINNLNNEITDLLKSKPINKQLLNFKHKDINYFFDNQVSLNYITQVKMTVVHFVTQLINEYFKQFYGTTENKWNKDTQLIFLSPHETFNFQKRYKEKDHKLPLFLVRFRNEPVTKNFRSPLLYKSNSESFMFDTKENTKKFLEEQYLELYQNDNPDYSKEKFKNYIFPTLYYDQVDQLCNIDLQVIQETQRELSNLFSIMNTSIFQNEKQKYNYQLQIDSFLKTTNNDLSSLQDRFYFPLFYIINYYVTWQQYSNSTVLDSQNEWNLQKQMYTFKFESYPMTRFNLSQSLLNIGLKYEDTLDQIQEVE